MKAATRADVAHVAQHMWDRGIEELKYWPGDGGGLGVDPREWLASWHERIAKGDAVAFGPHAIMGWDHQRPGVVTSSFQASKSFEEPGVGLQVTKEIRRAIPKLMEGRGVNEIWTFSLCVVPKAEQWFRLLGLHEAKWPGLQCGPYRMRKFIRSL